MATTERTNYADPRKAVPLYRAFNATITDHLLTTSEASIEAHVSNHGYIAEGLAAYIFPGQEAGTRPLYKLWNPTICDHFYTMSLAEREDFLVKAQWLDEGIAGFIFPDEERGGRPFFRLWNAQRGDHHYTVSSLEKTEAMTRGYEYEGVVGYVYPAMAC